MNEENFRNIDKYLRHLDDKFNHRFIALENNYAQIEGMLKGLRLGMWISSAAISMIITLIAWVYTHDQNSINDRMIYLEHPVAIYKKY